MLDRLVVGRARVPVHLTRPSISIWHYVNIHAARLPDTDANSPGCGDRGRNPLTTSDRGTSKGGPRWMLDTRGNTSLAVAGLDPSPPVPRD